MNRLIPFSLLALFTVAGSSLGVTADVKPQASTNSLVDLASVEPAVPARDTSSLRCWQYGELLFEETHLSETRLTSTENMLVFESDARPGYQNGIERKLYLINSGSATCLYEKL